MKKHSVLLIWITFLLFVSCSGSDEVYKDGLAQGITSYLYDIPDEIKTPFQQARTLTEYSKHLQGVKIFLDPGHGGDDKRNKSPNGHVVEAEINLKVALHLRSFLVKAGAEVIMTRESDTTVTLQQRADMANESSADFFISIHHNSTSDSNRNWVNYTSTFYHSEAGRSDFDPFEHQLAQYIQRDLSFAVGNPGGLGSFDGTYSDFVVVPDSGFYVLRNVNIPGVLVECTFFTHRTEEIRLQIDQFNKIEAWGILNGLMKFITSDYPRLSLSTARSTFNRNDLELIFEFVDGRPINFESVQIFWNGEKISFTPQSGNRLIKVSVSNDVKNFNTVKVIAADNDGRFAYPFIRQLSFN